jgi:hypothetical protein
MALTPVIGGPAEGLLKPLIWAELEISKLGRWYYTTGLIHKIYLGARQPQRKSLKDVVQLH